MNLSNMEPTPKEAIVPSTPSDIKLYSEARMLVGVAIGGPLALAYYLVRTLRALGKSNLAIGLAVILPVGLLILSIASVFVPALQRLPDPFWYLLQFGILWGFTRWYAFLELRSYLAKGDPIYGWGNTLVVAVISVVFTLALLAPFLFLASDINTDLPKETYGKLKHEIYYDPSNIKKPELDRLAKALTETNFFDEEVKKSIQINRSENTYIVAIFFSPEANKPEVIAPYRELRAELQKDFPVNKIVIDMVVDTAENRFARLE